MLGKVSDASNLARRLIAYDPALARRILGMLVEELGGPAPDADELDLGHVRGFLFQAESFFAPEVGDPRTSTREWKTDLAHRESARALARELVELLQSRGSPSQ
jgi:hypothetical protein